jgi:serine/threonine protein kinase
MSPEQIQTIAPAGSWSYSVGQEVQGFTVAERWKQTEYAQLYLLSDGCFNGQNVLKVPTNNGKGKRLKLAQNLIREEAERHWELTLAEVPDIVELVDASSDNAPFTITEYLKGSTLHDDVRHQTRSTGELTLPNSQDVARFGGLLSVVGKTAQVAHHRGFSLTDIKPENICFEDDEHTRVKVIDLGSVVELGSQTIRGTLGYGSLESMERKPIDEWHDVASLGATAYYCFTGEHPYQQLGLGAKFTPIDFYERLQEADAHPEHISRTNPAIPEWAGDIVMRALPTTPVDERATTSDIMQLGQLAA